MMEMEGGRLSSAICRLAMFELVLTSSNRLLNHYITDVCVLGLSLLLNHNVIPALGSYKNLTKYKQPPTEILILRQFCHLAWLVDNNRIIACTNHLSKHCNL